MSRTARVTLVLAGLTLLACDNDPTNPGALRPIPSGPSQNIIAGSGAWAVKHSFPIPIEAPTQMAVAGNRLWVFGGQSSGNPLNSVYRYDPLTDSWDSPTTMPEAAAEAAAVTVNGKIYVIGGADLGGSRNKLLVYDTLSGQWSNGAPMSTARQSPIVATLAGKIYVFGGINFAPTATGEVYDRATNTWSPVASMPGERLRAVAGVINGKIYLASGQGAGFGPNDAIYIYDPGIDSWTTGTTGGPSDDHPGGVVGGLLYVLTPGPASSRAYDPATDSWTSVAVSPSSALPYYGPYGVINGTIYSAGGYDGGDVATVLAFTPAFAGNHQPVINIGGPYSGTEGSAINFSSSGSSDPDGDALTYAWSFGDGGTSTAASPSHTYGDAGTYNVTLTITDAGGRSNSITKRAVVADVAPVITMDPGPDTLIVNENYNHPGSFTDPGTNTWTASVNWQDGSGSHPVTLTDKAFTLGMSFGPGRHPVTVRISDGHLTSAATASVVVLTRPGAVDILRAQTAAALAGTTATGEFIALIDAKVNEIHRQVALGHVANAIEALVEYKDIIEFGAVPEYGLDAGVAAGLKDWASRIQGTFPA